MNDTLEKLFARLEEMDAKIDIMDARLIRVEDTVNRIENVQTHEVVGNCNINPILSYKKTPFRVL